MDEKVLTADGTIKDFMSGLRNMDVRLWLDGGSLRYRAPKGTVTKELLNLIGGRKDEIIRYLTHEPEYDSVCIPRAENKEYYPLTPAQRRMFVLNRLDEDSTAYNTTVALRLHGVVDKERTRNAFELLTQRHESLRTTFEIADGEPVSKIHKNVDFVLGHVKAEGGDDKLESLLKDFVRPYDLSRLPLFRIELVELCTPEKEKRLYLLFDIHHIISDGLSASIIIKEFNAIYKGQKLPAPLVQYKDYAVWYGKLMSGERMQRQKKYWLCRLGGDLPALDLPLDFVRPVRFDPEGESIHDRLGSELTERLNMFARKNRVTLFTTLLSAYYVLLSKYSGQDDIVVGTPVSGRTCEDTGGIVGILLNTLPLRNRPRPELTFTDFVKEVGKNCAEAFDNQDYPFDRLVEDLNIKRNAGRNPVFSTMFVMQNPEGEELAAGGGGASVYKIKHKMAQVDITVNVSEAKSGVDIEINFSTGLFRRCTMERFMRHYINILEFAAANGATKIADIDMLQHDERKRILSSFSGAGHESGTYTTLHALFKKQAEKTPDAAALVFGEKELSYRELDRMSNNLARALIARGAGPEKKVAILSEPSLEMAAAILAVLKSGAAYLPIDPALPVERIKFMLNDSGSRTALAEGRFIPKLGHGMEILNLDDGKYFEGDGSSTETACTPENLAYVIYTSGTTGMPKGVAVEHKSIARTIKWRAKEYGFGSRDCALELFSYSFDGFLTGFFTPLISGAKVVLLHKNEEKDPDAVIKQIVSQKVTHFICVPVLYSALIDRMRPEEMKGLKAVTLAGDKIPAETVKLSREKNPGLEIVNEYGPTESAVVTAVRRNLTEKTVRSIGRPVADTEIYILDPRGAVQPVGVPGELCISGGRLARGYQNRPDITKQRFIMNPFVPGQRLYKTGDIGKWLDDGNIEFIGRADGQVKIRGYRIETAEVETALLKHKAVKEAVVVARAGKAKNKYLCAYIVSEEKLSEALLRGFLLRFLPEYMIPARFVKIDSVPLSPNGKVDRKALPEPGVRVDPGTGGGKPKGDTEKKIGSAWEEVLKVKDLDVNSNFFDVGGDSMSIINLHSAIDKIYPKILTVTDLFSYSTVKSQAAYIENMLEGRKNTIREKPKNQKQVKTGGDIAIIGISVDLPGAADTDEFWSNILKKADFIRDMPAERKTDADAILESEGRNVNSSEYEKLAYLNEVDKFDYAFFGISPKEACLMDPNQKLFLETAWNAVEDAGYGGRLKGTRTGVYVGFSGESEYGKYILRTCPESYTAAAAGNLSSIIAGRVSYTMDLKGPSLIINTACSSSLAAVHYACRGINSGECDMAIAGSVKTWLCSVEGEFQMGIESAGGKTRTFDDAADGTAKGEGVAAILLKPVEKAIADGDPIYAVIKGGFVNQDGASNGITAPNPAAQTDVLTKAWEDAGIDPETLGYIEAHGTGTKLGDPIEINSLQKAFEQYTDKKQFCAIGSVKTNIGHLENAAGVVSVIKAALALKNKVIPPTNNFTYPNRAINFINSPVYVSDEAQKWEDRGYPRRCGVSAFGLSGTNCHIVMEEAPERARRKETEDKRPNVLAVSAKSRESLLMLIEECVAKYKNGIDGGTLRELCYTLNTGRGHYRFRAAAVIEETDCLSEKLNDLGLTVRHSKDACFADGNGVFYGDCERKGKDRFSDHKKLSGQVHCEKSDALTLKEICKSYVRGAYVDWNELYNGENLLKVNAPVYPFLKQRCWIGQQDPKKAYDGMYYTVAWGNKELSPGKESLKGKKVLIMSDVHDTDLTKELRRRCGTPDGTTLKSLDVGSLGTEELPQDCDTAVFVLPEGRDVNSAEKLDGRLESCVINLLSFVKRACRSFRNGAGLVVIGKNVSEVTGREESINPENAAAFGLIKSAALECPEIRFRTIDTDEKTPADMIADEIDIGTDYNVAYRNGKRFVDEIERFSISNPGAGLKVKEDGVYIISGGAGRIGIEAGKWLASKGRANIVLVNRRPLPDKSGWDKILKMGRSEELCDKINGIKEMEKTGSSVICRSCDVSSEEDVKNLLSELRGKFGSINGIIHCAAVNVGRAGRSIKDTKAGSIIDDLRPKARGAFLLDTMTREDKPDFFIMFSSAVTLTGGLGSCGYTAANAFLDSYAEKRSMDGLRTLAVDWPAFKKKRKVSGIDENKFMFRELPAERGMACLDRLPEESPPRIVIGEMNFSSNVLTMEGKLPFRLSGGLRKSVIGHGTSEKKSAAEAAAWSPMDEGDDTERKIAGLYAQVLGYEKISVHDDFFKLGGQSLLAMDLISKLGKTFHKDISLECLLENPTVEKLAAVFRKGPAGSSDNEYEEITI